MQVVRAWDTEWAEWVEWAMEEWVEWVEWAEWAEWAMEVWAMVEWEEWAEWAMEVWAMAEWEEWAKWEEWAEWAMEEWAEWVEWAMAAWALAAWAEWAMEAWAMEVWAVVSTDTVNVSNGGARSTGDPRGFAAKIAGDELDVAGGRVAMTTPSISQVRLIYLNPFFAAISLRALGMVLIRGDTFSRFLGQSPLTILPASGEQIVMLPSHKGNNCILCSPH